MGRVPGHKAAIIASGTKASVLLPYLLGVDHDTLLCNIISRQKSGPIGTLSSGNQCQIDTTELDANGMAADAPVDDPAGRRTRPGRKYTSRACEECRRRRAKVLVQSTS